jgi:Flp pilus assembly protein TadG
VIGGRLSRYRADQGAAAVEASITLSLLLLLIIGSVEFGRVSWTQHTMLLAVQEAGRFAMIGNVAAAPNCGAQSQARSCPAPSNTALTNCSAARARQVLLSYQATNIDVSVNENQTSTPGTLTVCASRSFDFAAPRLLRYGPLNMTSQLTVPLVEQR